MNDLERRIRHLERDDLTGALRKIADDAGQARQMLENLHYGRYGGGGGTGCTQVINVTGCGGLPLAGATVVYNGDTQTTDGSGNATFSGIGLVSGTNYAYSVNKSPRFTTKTGTLTANCGTLTVAMNLNVASGYVCSPSAGTGAGILQCADPIATTLFLTDSHFGSFTLTYGTAYGSGAWYGCGQVTPAANLQNNGCTAASAGTTPLAWQLDPTGTNIAGSFLTFGGLSCPVFPRVGACGTLAFTAVGSVSSSSCPPAVAVAGSVGPYAAGYGANMWGVGVTGTITVTE